MTDDDDPIRQLRSMPAFEDALQDAGISYRIRSVDVEEVLSYPGEMTVDPQTIRIEVDLYV